MNHSSSYRIDIDYHDNEHYNEPIAQPARDQFMSIKSERVTILTTPDFKAFLNEEAEKEGVSVSELIRERCMNPTATDDAFLLKALIDQVHESTEKASQALDDGLQQAHQVLAQLKAARYERD